ncbi:MAG: SAM-dependent methyltransferase [Bacteroidetes bacterium GWC2_33_15]|nr:MAG: SAM-dependent methyltransferase [Bacteroidetes bacterium GWA2_33_15]OFX49956.1 MAG: SAM-dependent methyltransferase [Bacteroidetes bacterium GWC2_33_15]OFX64196.1 MAG: SAM-dependent methyltransferase [Bacteroidetes bacterium GWB2_32_14]OFX69608.1 MAG: SAM-dependent methyltransferase [Bacteroidetes bacterium GWD2_33_33]HAN19491.1 SAM-dependent methyltransferase [Bacteroidales bacterium]
MTAKLYLIPTTLGESPIENVIPSYLIDIINQTNHYIVENVKTARRYLIKAGIKTRIDDLTFYTLNKHSSPEEYESFLKPIFEDNHVGIISEAGTPGVADPGAEIVKIAHQRNIDVVPLVGPSSILLSVMASGLNGQNFAFLGYLPIQKAERIKTLKEIEKRSLNENQTQLFIETPYRNNHLLEDIITTCHPETMLCIATDITLESEFIKTKTIKEWKSKVPDLNKKPTVFLIKKN